MKPCYVHIHTYYTINITSTLVSWSHEYIWSELLSAHPCISLLEGRTVSPLTDDVSSRDNAACTWLFQFQCQNTFTQPTRQTECLLSTLLPKINHTQVQTERSCCTFTAVWVGVSIPSRHNTVFTLCAGLCTKATLRGLECIMVGLLVTAIMDDDGPTSCDKVVYLKLCNNLPKEQLGKLACNWLMWSWNIQT